MLAACGGIMFSRTASLLFGTLVLTRPRSAATLVVGARAASSRRLVRGCAPLMSATPAVEASDESGRTCAKRDGSAPRLFATSAGEKSTLKLLNSLTGDTEPFVPIDPRVVKWYICGPTVYDASHVGHARNYVGFDIVRRVLSEYFGYDVLYVMNITDIDDKIILRTHLNHLLEMLAAVRAHTDSNEALAAALAAAEATAELPKPGLPELLGAQRDLAAAAASSGLDGVSACDVQKAFLELTSAYESDFFADMSRLNVLPPDAVTRVSDYVEEIIVYIKTIMANGYCYESNGSVYFDTAAFSSAPSKTYGKLDPSKIKLGSGDGADGTDWTEGKSSAELLLEAEGSLSAAAEGEKRNTADFVLWKASKEGEPAWDSPWGDGRPGWHIECSTMASDLLGDQVDVNAGGVDLKFPHHENRTCRRPNPLPLLTPATYARICSRVFSSQR